MQALGFLFDAGIEIAPYDTNAGAGTGLRVAMRNAGQCTFLYAKGAGVGTDVSVLTLQEHNAATGGTSQNLAAIDTVWAKTKTSIDGSEAWVKTTQAAAATYTNTGDATKQALYAIQVNEGALSDGFAWLSLSVADTGSAGAQLGCIIAILGFLEVHRTPANMPTFLNG